MGTEGLVVVKEKKNSMYNAHSNTAVLPVKRKPQATLLPNMGTCSLAICVQQASLPISEITGACTLNNTC